MSLCSTSRCPCSDSPFANLSSERPDHPVWVGMQWAEQVPFLGANWTSANCNASFLSEVSQQDADLKAAAAAESCVPETCFGPCHPCTSEDPNCNPCDGAGAGCQPVSRFCNVTQGCASDQTHATIQACSVVAHTQADADAIAASICQEIIRVDGIPNPPSSVCPTILGIFPPSPVHANEGDTVVLSVSVQYTGTGTLSFLWNLDGIPLAITSVPTLTLANVTAVDAGSYTVEVSTAGCPTVISPSVTLDVVSECTPDVGPAAPKVDPATSEYDYVTVESMGVFDIPFSFDYGICGSGGREFVDCGPFPDGWYNVYINSGTGWNLNGKTGGVPFDAPFGLGVGVEYQIGGFPVDVADEPLQGCLGFALFVPCPDPQNFMFDWFGVSEYPILFVPLQQHNGGHIRMWGPQLRETADLGTLSGSICGTQSRFELFRHTLASMPQNLVIRSFSTTKTKFSMCAACENRAGVEWDGTLSRVTYTPYDLRYEIPAPFDSNTISLNGKRISRSSCSIFLSELGDGTPIWVLQIKCKEPGQPNGGSSGDLIWSGIKEAGRTPDGTYIEDTFQNPHCNPGTNPDCVHVDVV